MKSRGINRRRFVAATAWTGVGLTAANYARAAGANDKIGVGFIGCGGRSTAHINMVKKLIDAGEPLEIVAMCDVYKPRANKKADGTSARIYMDHRELLADPAVDVVCISTPDHHHAQQAIDAMRAGKDVYCEKPISHWRQFELTKELARVARETKRVFQAGTQGLGDPVWRQAEQLVREGAIGQPVHAQCGYFRTGDWGERGMPIDDPHAKPGPDLLWEKFLGDSPKRPFDVSRFFRWRMYEDYAGGPVTDLFPHTLTPIVKVLGVKFPSVVVATGGIFRYPEREIPDTFNMLLDYPEKLTIAVLGTQANDYGVPDVFRGWDGALYFEGQNIVIQPVREAKKEKRVLPTERQMAREGSAETFENHWRDFLRCVRTREAPQGHIELAYHVQTALQMGMLSLRHGKAVRFDPKKEEIVV
ncbi:MAG: Gfo/Idh/MocA family oxidoreductase [Candidatus Sumerlaeia bacterium]|nr:Gfo/Idh/MocA family oxidoreductase [Candidatus Sumerlaeia bacterium]